MDLRKIFSVSGKPGLFELVSQGKQSAVVESLIDQKRFPIFADSPLSSLEEISMFTEDGDILLKEVLKSIYKKENGGLAIDSKSDNKKLEIYFSEVLPNYDRSKVYISDIKKAISWYNILQAKGYIDLEEDPKE